ncbi:MAG: hypothetical protein PHH04_00900 [Thomasclavelia sp.]|nr:hypothetical protein [Thomasclavelia sp.]
MKKKILLIYVLVFFIMISIPSVGMIWNETTQTKEKKELASLPSLENKDGSFNSKVGDDFDSYLGDHFAYKQQLVTANAMLRSQIFKESTESQVIQGKDGYLFYKEGVNNYIGENVLNDREIYNITRTLNMIQEYCNKNNIKLSFTIAPNKSTLYPQYLPDNYSTQITKNNSLTKLTKSLKNTNVNYVDLKSTFNNQNEVLYHKLDSHWNNKGAMLASNRILSSINKNHTNYDDISYVVRKDYEGDLYDMVYPSGNKKDNQIYYDIKNNFKIESENNTFEDQFVETTNDNKEGNVFVFRDSFGNSMNQFIANEYHKAYFSRESGYNLDYLKKYNCDTLIIEITERHLKTLQSIIPVMEAPIVSTTRTPTTVKNNSTMEVFDFDNQYMIQGALDKNYTSKDSNVYIKVHDGDTEFMFEATPSTYSNGKKTTNYGYGAYIDKSFIKTKSPSFEIITKKGDSFISSGIIKKL